MNLKKLLSALTWAEKTGVFAIYFALGVIYIWFGGMKFTAGTAESMYGMISVNPLVSWMYLFLSKQGLVNFLGSIEIITGLLFLSRIISPVLSIIAGLLSLIIFTVTITMLLFLPGSFAESGFPVLTFLGEFLLKDIGLFAASLFVLGHSVRSLLR